MCADILCTYNILFSLLLGGGADDVYNVKFAEMYELIIDFSTLTIARYE